MAHTGPGLITACLLIGCGFAPLEPVQEPAPSQASTPDDLDGAANVGGILVGSAIIHPGDHVRLRDASATELGRDATGLAYYYYWDACAGAFVEDARDHGPERTWIAPDEPGTYSVTVTEVNHEGAFRGNSSAILELCVAPSGSDDCTGATITAPELASVQADPDIFLQGCGDGCEPIVTANVGTSAPESLEFRWLAARGTIYGSGPSVRWRLPSVGCCTESFTISVSVCSSTGGAAVGYTRATVVPE